MNQEEDTVSSEASKLWFKLSFSRRYHRSREQWFDRVNQLCSFVVAFLSSGVVVTWLAGFTYHSYFLVSAAVLAGLASASQLAFSLSRSARLHAELAAAFTLVQRDLELSSPRYTISVLQRFKARILEIESREPPQLTVLSCLCYNDTVIALGSSTPLIDVTRIQRFFSPVLSLGAAKLERKKQSVLHSRFPSSSGSQ